MSEVQLCPQARLHTPCPEGYIQWHAWAEEMSKTHKQIKCKGCGRYSIWVPKGNAMTDKDAMIEAVARAFASRYWEENHSYDALPKAARASLERAIAHALTALEPFMQAAREEERRAAFNAGLEAAETLRLRQVLTERDEGFEAALNAVRNLKIGEK